MYCNCLHFRNELSKYSRVFNFSINSAFQGRTFILSHSTRQAYCKSLKLKYMFIVIKINVVEKSLKAFAGTGVVSKAETDLGIFA